MRATKRLISSEQTGANNFHLRRRKEKYNECFYWARHVHDFLLFARGRTALCTFFNCDIARIASKIWRSKTRVINCAHLFILFCCFCNYFNLLGKLTTNYYAILFYCNFLLFRLTASLCTTLPHHVPSVRLKIELADRWTDRPTDRTTDRLTDKQTDI